MARLFLAVRPPPAVLDRIARLPRPAEPGVRWVPPDQWHVTLRFLGEVELADAMATLQEPVEVVGPVEVELGPAVSRLGRNVVCLPAHGLDDLAGTLAERTAGLGDPPSSRPFTGHLTLARLRHRGVCGLAGTRFEASFPVREVELVRSRLGNRGATHTTELVVAVVAP